MMKVWLKATLAGFLLMGALYVTFWAPLGDRTLFEHAQEIADTDEAHQLGDGIGTAADRLGGKVRQGAERVSDAVRDD